MLFYNINYNLSDNFKIYEYIEIIKNNYYAIILSNLKTLNYSGL